MTSSVYLKIALFIVCFLSVFGQEWKFSWQESKLWNSLRDQKIESSKTMPDPLMHVDLPTEGSTLIGGKPVYVSLTIISNRMHLLSRTLQSIISGSVVPSMIYVFVSSEPHLIDTGIKESDIMDPSLGLTNLLELFPNIKFVFTENIGPHRKVLPLLNHKLNEDCVIISVDDDHIYQHHWMRDMLAYFVYSKGEAIISTRARRIAICSGQEPYRIAPYMRATTTGVHTQWFEAAPHTNEMLLLPTGVGGVLYRPRFFNLSVAFNKDMFSVTLKADDLSFRLATLANRIPVYTACVQGDFKDNKIIEKCPVLPGVNFQHLVRRRLSSGLPGPDFGALATHARARAATRGAMSAVTVTGKRPRRLRRGVPGTDTEDLISLPEGKTLRRGGGSGGPSQFGHNSTSRVGPHAGHHGEGRNHSHAHRYAGLHEGVNITEYMRHMAANRTKLLHEAATVKVPAKNIDHGKQGSLSGMNSKHDGNFHQWNKANAVLKQSGLFDVDEFIQDYVYRERRSCVASSLLLNYDNRSWAGNVLGSVATQMQNVKEQWQDSRCGVVSCSH